MRDEIISYDDIVEAEGARLQKGINFRVSKKHSVMLMSLRDGKPYSDEIDEKTGSLIYEGHDAAKNHSADPKNSDQPLYLPSGKLTENGKLMKAVLDYKEGKSNPELVQVYEKIKKGLWSDKGFFNLVDANIVHVGNRNVFRFSLHPVDIGVGVFKRPVEISPTRIIPSNVKVEVWRRDKGKCVVCGATQNLHFDHDIPFSEGGSSLTAKNVQLLCMKHNLEKSNKIVAFLPLLFPIGMAIGSVLEHKL